MADIFMNLIRSFGFVLDNVVYSLIPIIYKLFIYLSEINLFSMDDSTPIGGLIGRVYVFLGIFMLFKVTFSLIQYLIDPNSFSDKAKGFGKLVTNAMVTILLLVSVPYIFNYAMILQNEIVTSNAIGTLILGDTSGKMVTETTTDENGNKVAAKLNTETVNEMATDVQFLMYGAFFSINPNAKINKPDVPNSCANSPIFGTVDMAKNEACLDDLNKEFNDGTKNDMAKYNVTLQDFFKTVELDENGNIILDENGNPVIDKTRNFSNFDKLLWWKDSDGQYVINYLPFVSAAAGLYVVFLLITFSIDIAVRAIKLCFLEMIAPIAIVSYIDPKESMSNSKLRNWIKESLSTYFSLFLRIATLFLVMLLISVIASSVLAQNGPISQQINDNEYNIWIYLFLIIGAFMFAKKVPQMIENIFGIKMSGELNLNPFKAYKESGLGTAVGLGGAAIGGTALGGIGNTVANLKRNKDLREKLADGKISQEDFNRQYRGKMSMIGSTIGGMGSGFFRSAKLGAKSQNPVTATAQGVKASSNQRRAREAGYGFFQNARDTWTDMAGIPGSYGTTSEIKDKIKALTQRQANAQRDETMAAYQMQQIMGHDIHKMDSFRKAFEENEEGNLVYQNYENFFKHQMSNYGELGQMGIEEFDRLMQTETDPQELSRKLDLLASNYSGLISNTDYAEYNSAREAREQADKLGKDLEKQIEQLKETKGMKKEVSQKK